MFRKFDGIKKELVINNFDAPDLLENVKIADKLFISYIATMQKSFNDTYMFGINARNVDSYYKKSIAYSYLVKIFQNFNGRYIEFDCLTEYVALVLNEFPLISNLMIDGHRSGVIDNLQLFLNKNVTIRNIIFQNYGHFINLSNNYTVTHLDDLTSAHVFIDPYLKRNQQILKINKERALTCLKLPLCKDVCQLIAKTVFNQKYDREHLEILGSKLDNRNDI